MSVFQGFRSWTDAKQFTCDARSELERQFTSLINDLRSAASLETINYGIRCHGLAALHAWDVDYLAWRELQPEYAYYLPCSNSNSMDAYLPINRRNGVDLPFQQSCPENFNWDTAKLREYSGDPRLPDVMETSVVGNFGACSWHEDLSETNLENWLIEGVEGMFGAELLLSKFITETQVDFYDEDWKWMGISIGRCVARLVLMKAEPIDLSLEPGIVDSPCREGPRPELQLNYDGWTYHQPNFEFDAILGSFAVYVDASEILLGQSSGNVCDVGQEPPLGSYCLDSNKDIRCLNGSCDSRTTTKSDGLTSAEIVPSSETNLETEGQFAMNLSLIVSSTSLNSEIVWALYLKYTIFGISNATKVQIGAFEESNNRLVLIVMEIPKEVNSILESCTGNEVYNLSLDITLMRNSLNHSTEVPIVGGENENHLLTCLYGDGRWYCSSDEVVAAREKTLLITFPLPHWRKTTTTSAFALCLIIIPIIFSLHLWSVYKLDHLQRFSSSIHGLDDHNIDETTGKVQWGMSSF